MDRLGPIWEIRTEKFFRQCDLLVGEWTNFLTIDG